MAAQESKENLGNTNNDSVRLFLHNQTNECMSNANFFYQSSFI